MIVNNQQVSPWLDSPLSLDNGTNAKALADQFLEALYEVGLPVQKMRAQRYDAASVISEHINGVQARIRRLHSKAAYIHCRGHVLNLCIVHASKIPQNSET